MDLSGVPDVILWLMPVLGVAGVVWAFAITRQGREREREVLRLSDEAHSIKNDFVAMVSHELRTPLTSIAGFADTLVESWRDLPPEEVDEFLGIINRQALYLADLVEDLPDVLVYTSPVLDQPVQVIGPVGLHLHLS